MCGLQLKRQGLRVTILEQDPASERSSHNAGIRIDEHVNEFLSRYNNVDQKISIESHANFISIKKRLNAIKGDKGTTRYWTNWGYLYRLLRANFDGYSSQACPNVPEPRSGEGEALYLTGKRVTGLQYIENGGLVTVSFVDEAGTQMSLTAGLVIGADGIHSTVRKLVQAPMARPVEYAGFIAWRGAVPRKDLSPETANFFYNKVTTDLLGGGMYVICYVIPTDEGNFDPQELLVNWVLYQVPTDEEDIFTDVQGRHHQRTVPQGLVCPGTWVSHQEDIASRMAPPFAELIRCTTNPFVTKVSDLLSAKASFLDGRVILIGDAVATLRPHAGRATDQAALHCLSLLEVVQQKKSAAEWEQEVCISSQKMFLWSRIMGEGLRWRWFSFLKSVVLYIFFICKLRLGRARL